MQQLEGAAKNNGPQTDAVGEEGERGVAGADAKHPQAERQNTFGQGVTLLSAATP